MALVSQNALSVFIALRVHHRAQPGAADPWGGHREEGIGEWLLRRAKLAQRHHLGLCGKCTKADPLSRHRAPSLAERSD